MRTFTEIMVSEKVCTQKEFAELTKAALSSPQAVEWVKKLSKIIPIAGMSASPNVNETYFNEGQRNIVAEICRYAGVV